jgi:hypothetical protein
MEAIREAERGNRNSESDTDSDLPNLARDRLNHCLVLSPVNPLIYVLKNR